MDITHLDGHKVLHCLHTLEWQQDGHTQLAYNVISMNACAYIPYGRKFWREEYLADCSNNVIWRILLWRLGKPYTLIIFIAKW